MNNNEQWISGGNCSICRRRKYCHKNCKAKLEKLEQNIKNTLCSALIKNISGGN